VGDSLTNRTFPIPLLAQVSVSKERPELRSKLACKRRVVGVVRYGE